MKYLRVFFPSKEERDSSSTSRELSVFEDFYNSFGQALAGSAVEHFTDSQNVAHILEVIGHSRENLVLFFPSLFVSSAK